MKKFSNCEKCLLKDNTNFHYIKTNCEKNIKEIDELYITMFTNYNDLNTELEKASNKYLIVSPIMCDCENNQFEDVLQICKKNIESIIKISNPKKIICIGEKTDSFKCDQKFNDINEFKEFTKKKEDDLFDFSFLNNNSIENKKETTNEIFSEEILNPEKGLYKYTIPEKYYSTDYKLIDIQTVVNQGRIIYIFRDKNNKKEFYEIPVKENDFYWYESECDRKLIEEYSNLQLKIGNYQKRPRHNRCYGSDINICTLHSVDYFLQTKGECELKDKNILFFDCEMYTFKDKIFPDPDKAIYPINAISFTTDREDDHVQMYLLKIKDEIDSKIDKIIKSKKYTSVTVFTDEASMIDAFLSKIQEIEPDFISGYNSLKFDFPYLINRMKKLQIPYERLSPFKNVYASSAGNVIITGYIPMDQLKLYKELTYINLPSYTLNYVSEFVTGEKKVKYDGNLNTLYSDNVDLFIQYSLQDTNLLKKIENKVKHIALQDELRVITTTAHNGASSTLGQAEGLFVTSMKKQGLISRNKNQSEVVKEKLPGAFVMEAKGGIYNGMLCDFDFQSLYPSIINSWNLGIDTYIAKILNEQDSFNFIYDRESLKDKKIEVVFDPLYKNEKKSISVEELDDFINKNQATINITGTIFTGHSIKESVFYSVIKMLFDGRKIYKKKMLDAKEKGDNLTETVYNGKQMAFKILANSLYGALGNEYFRMYCIDLAKSITLAGQELLKYSCVHMDEYIEKRGNIPEFKINNSFIKEIDHLNSVLYGDTDSAFVNFTEYLNDKNIKIEKSPEVLNEISKAQNYINDTALNKFIELHNIDKTRSMIYLKNEFLFSKYYTLNGKKHYALKIIAQEGKDVKFTEIKGLEMKRSEIPSYSQKLLTEILDMILSDNNENVLDMILKRVDEAKIEAIKLIDERDNSIVRVSSFSKKISEYKNLPQHIKAMRIWNLLSGKEEFRQHSKGYLWNLMGVKLDKAPEHIKKNYSEKFLKEFKASDLDVICLPEDVKKLPAWCEPNVKQILEYAIQDRIDNLIEPLVKPVQMLLF